MCRQPQRKASENQDKADAFLCAPVQLFEESNTFSTVSAVSTTQEINMQLTPTTRLKKPSGKTCTISVFPDSGASLCLAGPQHITKLGIDPDSLIPSQRRVKAVGGSILECKGWLPMKFQIGNHSTVQPLFICDKVDRICFSKNGCQKTNILSRYFPYQWTHPTKSPK